MTLSETKKNGTVISRKTIMAIHNTPLGVPDRVIHLVYQKKKYYIFKRWNILFNKANIIKCMRRIAPKKRFLFSPLLLSPESTT